LWKPIRALPRATYGLCLTSLFVLLNINVHCGFSGDSSLFILGANLERIIKRFLKKDFYPIPKNQFKLIQILEKFGRGAINAYKNAFVPSFTAREQYLLHLQDLSVFGWNGVPMGVKSRKTKVFVQFLHQLFTLHVFQLFRYIVHLVPSKFQFLY